jgi:hypothetical protein
MPAERPGLRGPFCWAARVEPAASAASATGAGKASKPAASMIMKIRIPKVFYFKRLFGLAI